MPSAPGTRPSPNWWPTAAYAPTCARPSPARRDLERLSARAGTGRASPRDLVALAKTLALLPKIKARLTARASRLLAALEGELELLPEVRESIDAALVDDPPHTPKEGGLIKEGYHPTLDDLRETAKGGKSWIARFQAEQVRRTGINSLKVGFNKVFGYYIEITHSQGSKVPPDYVRKQTVKNAERYITPELKEYEDKVLRAEDRACELEHELFARPARPRRRRGAAPDPGRRGPLPGRRPRGPGRAGGEAGVLPPGNRLRPHPGDRSRPPSGAGCH